MSINSKKVGILGAGSWGTALAILFARKGFEVFLWCYEEELVKNINKKRENHLYLANINIPEGVTAFSSMEPILKNCSMIIECVPSEFLRTTIQKAAKFFDPEFNVIVSTTKGIERNTALFPLQIIRDSIGSKNFRFAILSGPNFHRDVVENKLSGTTIACRDKELGESLRKAFSDINFKVELTDDIVGVEICGAFKNIIALAFGLVKGAKLSENTSAFVLTKGLKEVGKVVTAAGGKIETLYGLAGFGDMYLTAHGKEGRNCFVGEFLGGGKSVLEVKKKWKNFPESLNTVEPAILFSKKIGLDLPLCRAVRDFIFVDGSVEKFKNKIQEIV